MPNLNDLYAQDILAGNRRGLLMPETQNRIAKARAASVRVKDGFSVIDPLIDQVWGGNVPSQAPHSYFDYYFSGQDMQVYVDGTASDPEFATLPIQSLGFNVSQNKQPVFGFWSYTYDAVMRGSRLINGQITLATRAPDYMRRLLSKAAETRALTGQGSYVYNRGLTEDDQNIEQYWGRNIDPAVTAAGKNIFSIHPPFSLVIIYGVQSVSVNPDYNGNRQEVFNSYNDDQPLFADTNERLVDSDNTDYATRIILDAIELKDMQTGYGPDGAVISETYSFFARDIIIPSRATGQTVPGTAQLPVPDNPINAR